MIRTGTILVLSGTLAACAVNPREMGREPELSPVGSGLHGAHTPGAKLSAMNEPIQMAAHRVPIVPPVVRRPGGSLWEDASADLFRDTRAMKVGDVVTVKIAIKDRASLDNTSNRSRNSSVNIGATGKYDLHIPRNTLSGDGSASTGVDTKSSSKGEGAIIRSESIELMIAAVVTDVMPNGNLVISGSQEVRVNFEVRVLSVAGVVRPRDISTGNSVAYDRIAEARISYGGRGRITEVQQPSLGQQLLDIISPF